MGEIPGIFERVNFVTRMWNNPCDVPWILYVETAKPAALDAAIAIACFDIGDVLRFVFRPAGLRSGRHGRKSRRGGNRRRAKGIRALLARKLPPFKRLQQRKLTQGVKNLWIIDGIGQRLLWWWLIADVASGFLYNWTSMIYKTEQCQMQLAPGAALWVGNSQVFIPLGGWSPVSFNLKSYSRGGAAINVFVYVTGAGEYNLVASVHVTNGFSDPIEAEMRFRVQDEDGVRHIEGGATPIPAEGAGSVMVTATLEKPSSGWAELRINGGALFGDDGAFAIMGTPPEMPPPVKHKCNSIFWEPFQ